MKKEDLFDDISQDTANPNDQMLDDRFTGDDDDTMDQIDQGQLGQDVDGDIQDGGLEHDNATEFDFESLQVQSEEHAKMDVDEYPTEDIFGLGENQEEKPTPDQTQQKQEDPELERLNKALETDYKSIEDLKKALRGEEPAPTADQEALTAQEKEIFEKNNDVINYFAKQKEKPAEELVFEHLKSIHKKKNNDQFSEDDEEELNDKISIMDTNGTLDLYADNLRTKIDNAVDKLTRQNSEIQNKQQEFVDKKNIAFKNTLQDSFVDIASKDSFYGVKVEKDDIKETYNDIITGKFYKDVENNPKLIVELAMFKKYKDIIQSKTSGPSYSDGVKDIVSEIRGKKDDVRTTQARSGVRNNTQLNGLKSRWLQ